MASLKDTYERKYGKLNVEEESKPQKSALQEAYERKYGRLDISLPNSDYRQSVEQPVSTVEPSLDTKDLTREAAHNYFNNLGDNRDVVANTMDNMSKAEKFGNKVIDFIDKLSGNSHGSVYGNTTINPNAQALIDKGYTVEEAGKAFKDYDNAKGILDAEKYEDKRSKALEGISKDEYDLISRYNLIRSSNATKNMFNVGIGQKTYVTGELNDVISKLSEMGIDVNSDDFKKKAQYVKEVTDKQLTDVQTQMIQNDIANSNGHAVAWNAFDLATSMGQGVTAAAESIKKLGYADKEAPVNTNSGLYALSNMAQAVESATTDKIDSQVGKYAYNIGMSTAKSAEAMLVGGSLGKVLGTTEKGAKFIAQLVTLPTFGSSAYATTLKEAQDKGLPESSAVKTAIASGVAEMLFEELSLDKVWGSFMDASVGKGGIAKKILDVIVGAGIEGSEEFATDMANFISDNFVNGDYSDYNTSIRMYEAEGMTKKEATELAKKDTLRSWVESFLMGMASGGIMNASAAGLGSINYHNMAKTVKADSELFDKVRDIAMHQMPKDSDAFKIANKEGELSTIQTAEMLDSMTELTSGKDITEVLAQALEAKGESAESASENAKKLVEMSAQNLDEMSAKEAKAIEKENINTLSNDNVASTYGDLLQGKTSVNVLNEIQDRRETVKNIERNARANFKLDVRAKSNEDPVRVYDFVDNKKGLVNTSLGVKDYTHLEFENNGFLYKSGQNFEDTATANAFINGYKGQKPSSYLGVSYKAFNAGASGISFEKLLNDSVFKVFMADVDDMAYVREMYEHGVASKDTKNVQIDKTKATNLGKATGNSQISPVLESVARVFNINIEETESAKNENGSFTPSTGKMLLNVLADKNAYTTMQHELGEYAKAYDNKAYNEAKSFVFDFLAEKHGLVQLDDIISKYRDEYRKFGKKNNDAHEANKTFSDASDELFNDIIAMLMSSDEGIEETVDYLSKRDDLSLSEKDGIIKTIKDWIKKMIDSIKAFLNGSNNNGRVKEYADELKELEGIFDKITSMWDSARENQKIMLAEDAEGIDIVDDETVTHSVRTTLAETYESLGYKSYEEALDAIATDIANKLTKAPESIETFDEMKKKALKWLEAENSVASIILGSDEAMHFLDYEPDDNYEVIKKNSDYKQGTVDFSNLCRKREIFIMMFDSLQKKYNDILFTADDIAAIRQVLVGSDYEVACALCYVEDRRQKMGEIAQNFIDFYNDALKSKSGIIIKNVNGKKTQLYPSKWQESKYGIAHKPFVVDRSYTPNQYDLVTRDGFANLRKEHPSIAYAFERYNNSRGMASARLIEGHAEYKREILKYSKSEVDRINNMGGLRIFSFSDFEAIHLIDMIQVVTDASSVGLMAQAYTKVPAFAKIARNTGIKINRSLIPANVGSKNAYAMINGKAVKIDGNEIIADGLAKHNGKTVLVYDVVEGIDITSKDFFNSTNNRNVGNICIGISKDQIREAMKDKFVDYIIPFHPGQKKTVLHAKGIHRWDNYKDTQEDKNLSGTNLKKGTGINIYNDVLSKYDITNEKQFVEAFLKECKERKIMPRFSEFLNKDEKGNYVYTEGYYKFLLDYKLFDENGNILKQEIVRPDFEMSMANDILESDMARSKEIKFDDEIADKIEKALPKLSLSRHSIDLDFDLLDDDFFAELDEEFFGKKAAEEDFSNVSDLMNILKTRIDNSSESEKKNIQKHLTRKALGDQFSVKGKTIAFTDERIESYLSQFAATNKDYAQAYITYMSPADFILLTANGKKGSELFDRLMNESPDFSEEEFIKSIEKQPIFLSIDESGKNVRVIGHEGRHRMIALQLAGYTNIPVLLFNYDNKYSKKYIESMTLVPQNHDGMTKYNKSNYISISDIEPLSRGNADNVIAKFGSGKDSDVRYSVTVNSDGIEEYHLKSDLNKASYHDRKKIALKMVENEYKGKTIKFWRNGHAYYAFGSKDAMSKNMEGDRKSSRKGYKAKVSIAASGDFYELAEKSLYIGSSPERKHTNNYFHKNAKTWDYYIKTIKFNNTYFDVLINVKETGKDEYIYNVELNEAITLQDYLKSKDGRAIASDKMVTSDGYIVNKPVTFNSIAVDSEGNSLTESQQEYFAESKVRDAEGNLKVMYHGTNAEFEAFNPFVSGGKHGIHEGYGLYFADDKEVSKAYGNVLEGYLNIKKPATSFDKTISESNLTKLIKETCINEAETFVANGDYDNVEDALKDTWISNYVYTYDIPIERAFRDVAKSILKMESHDMGIIQEVMGGLAIRNYEAAYKFYDILQNTLGFDGFITEWEDSKTGKKSGIAVAINSNQFKLLSNENPTEDERINHSVSVDSRGYKLSQDQMNFFADSKARNENGNLLVLYHGSVTNEEFEVFDLNVRGNVHGRVLGDGFYFTPSPSKANSWASSRLYQAYLNIENPYYASASDSVPGNVRDYLIDKLGKEQADKQVKNAEDAILLLSDESEEITSILKSLGYDGVIYKDSKKNNSLMGGEQYVAFEPNQIKKTTNVIPTLSDSIKHSIDLSLAMMDEIFGDNEESPAASIIKEGIESIGNIKLSDKITKKIAGEIIKEYHSNYKREDLADSLSKVFSYLLDSGSSSYDDLVRIMKEIARPVIEESTEVEPYEREMYKKFNDFVKSYRIKLNSEQKAEVANVFGSYYGYKNSMFGKAFFSENGTYLDDVWTEICDNSNGLLSYGENPSTQPLALLEAFEAMKPASVNIYGGSIDDAAYDMALSIMRKFFIEQEHENNPKLKEQAEKLIKEQQNYKKRLAKKYDDKYKKLTEDLEKAKKIEMERIAREIKNLDELSRKELTEGTVEKALLEAEKEKYQKRLNKLREQNVRAIANMRAKQDESTLRKKQRQNATELRHKVKREVEQLNSMLTHPTSSRYIPRDMVLATIDMLNAIDINTGKSKSMSEYLERMQRIYEGYKENDVYSSDEKGNSFDYDARTNENLKRLKTLFEHRNYTELTNAELEEVLDIVHAIRTQAMNANKLLREGNETYAINEAINAINDVRASKTKDSVWMDMFDRYFTLHLNGYREFRKLSGYKDDSSVMALYDDLNEGYHKKLQEMKDLNSLFDKVLEGKENQKNARKFTSNKEEDLVEITDGVKATRAMRMSLLMHTYNKGNLMHILYGGLTVPNWHYYRKGNMAEAYARGTTIKFVDDEELRAAIIRKDAKAIEAIEKTAREKLRHLENDLSDWEREFLSSAKELFWKRTGELINDTSLRLKGYALAKVENYFPIRTDRNFVRQDITGLVQDGTIEGMGFLKERKFGKNPVILEDINNVITRQIDNVTSYSGLAIPVRNTNMVWNTTVKKDSFKRSIGQVWGNNNVKFIEDLIADLHRGRDGGRRTSFDNFRGRFAGAVLSLNPSVAMKQAASLPTAAAVVGWKPIFNAVANIRKGFSGKGIKELEDINPLLWYRNQGNATQDLADMKASGFGKNLPIKVQKALNWIEFMDSGTVRTLEYAAKEYVDENFKGLKGGDYWQKVSEIFSKMVEETQPNYTVLQQADIIREPNKFLKQLVMFKTQPMQNFGIIYDAVGQLRAAERSKNESRIADSKKNLKNAISSQMTSAMVFSFMTLLSKALLHKFKPFKDDDGWSAEEFFNNFGKGILDVMLGCILFGQEVINALESIVNGEKYYGMEVSTLGTINDLVTNTQGFVKTASEADMSTESGRKKTASKLYYYGGNLVGSIGQVAGIPVTSIKNILESLVLYSMDIANGEFGSSEIAKASNVPSQYELMYDAFLNGDMDKYHKLESELLTSVASEDDTAMEEAIEEATAKEQKKIDDALKKKIKEGFNSGKVTYEMAITMLIDEYGMSQMDAELKLDEWLWSQDHDDSYSKYSRLKESIHGSFDNGDSRKTINEEIQKLLDYGIESKTIATEITKEFKPLYLEFKQKGQAADLQNLLISCYMMCGQTKEEALKRIQAWK